MVFRRMCAPGGSNRCAKAWAHDCAWCVGGTARKPAWLEGSEQQGETEEERAGRGQAGHAGPCEMRGGLGLLVSRRWEPWRAVGRGGMGPDSGWGDGPYLGP